MKLAFSGQARYADMTDGYALYCKRRRQKEPVSLNTYTAVVKDYCRMLAEDLKKDGMVDLPSELGTIAAVRIDRRPQYRGDKFVGYGAYNWKAGHYDGEPNAFGITFLPRMDKNQNLRCYGFVANRRLFKEMKEMYNCGLNGWSLMSYGNEMI